MINEYGTLANNGQVKTKLFRENPAALPLWAPQTHVDYTGTEVWP
jgi:hypothetical protein